MELLPEDLNLEIPPSTLYDVRSYYGLEKPGKMDESIDILVEWVTKQEHFKKKDFSRDQLERIIIASKGSVERAKTRLEKYSTLRTLMPQFYGIFNLREDFKQYHRDISTIILPKFAPNYYRVYIMRGDNSVISAAAVREFFRIGMVFCEYWRWNDYLNGMIAVVDLTKVNIVQTLANINPSDLQMAFKIYIDAYGLRFKGLHIITPSKFVELFIKLMKQAVSEKVGRRIQVHKSLEELYKFVPKEILPKDYGGNEKSIDELKEEWIEELSSEKHTQCLREMMKVGVDETHKNSHQYKEEIMGLPGTFRSLSVD